MADLLHFLKVAHQFFTGFFACPLALASRAIFVWNIHCLRFQQAAHRQVFEAQAAAAMAEAQSSTSIAALQAEIGTLSEHVMLLEQRLIVTGDHDFVRMVLSIGTERRTCRC